MKKIKFNGFARVFGICSVFVLLPAGFISAEPGAVPSGFAASVATMTVKEMLVAGEKYMHGTEEQKQYAFLLFSEAAKKNDPAGQTFLGNCYDMGIGTAIDKKAAFDQYLAAAKKGYPQAQFNVGWDYKYGEGTSTDAEEACNWFKKAAKQGHRDAQYSYGGCLLEKDDFASREWFLKAAEQGHPDAQVMVAVHDSDIGYFSNAFAWYKKAAAQNNVFAIKKIAGAYETGNLKDLDMESLSESNRKLFSVMDDGKLIEKDGQKATEWYTKCAELGDAGCMVALGAIYHDGRLTVQDNKKAFYWFEKAAKQGNSAGEYNLGMSYQAGYGVPVDNIEALKWLTLSCLNTTKENFKNYSGARNQLMSRMKPEDVEKAQKLASDFKPEKK